MLVSQKLILVNWREDLKEIPAILPSSSTGADPGAPTPIQGITTIRSNEIFKLGRRETSLKKSWDKFGNVFEFHPNLFSIHNCPGFKLPYPSAMEIQLSITEAIMSYSVMSNADELDLEVGDQETSPTSAMSRLSSSDENETNEETEALTDQLESIRKAMNLRNRLVKMHKCNKIVCTNIMAYWGCLKIFTSENDSFRHQVNQIPMFDVWAFKDALFAHFHSTNSVILG